MKRWVVATDKTVELGDFKGQVAASTVPTPDGYNIGDWIEVLISEAEPRIVWRLICAEVEL